MVSVIKRNKSDAPRKSKKKVYPQPAPVVKTEPEQKTERLADSPESILKVTEKPSTSRNEKFTPVEFKPVTHPENVVPSLAVELALRASRQGLPMF